ncbi:MAG: ArsR family transcriptional regulator [Methanomassiliicoccales archaeon]|nr:MAG: ArsR family transcriptional regulator [Methanomassiliicoccales archaeon]
MSTDQNEIVERLEALHKDIKELNCMISEAKGDGFRNIIQSKMVELMSETNMERMRSNLDALVASSECPNRKACLEKIRDALALSVSRYKNDDFEGAMLSIKELEGILCSNSSPCKDSACSSIAQNLLRDTKLTMEISEKIKANIGPSVQRDVADDPEGIARALDPLSYPVRVRILLKLDAGESSFSDLSSSLGLRTGHLQHHLRPLCDAGYVSKARGRGRYAITVRGRKALDGAKKLVADIGQE